YEHTRRDGEAHSAEFCPAEHLFQRLTRDAAGDEPFEVGHGARLLEQNRSLVLGEDAAGRAKLPDQAVVRRRGGHSEGCPVAGSMFRSDAWCWQSHHERPRWCAGQSSCRPSAHASQIITPSYRRPLPLTLL